MKQRNKVGLLISLIILIGIVAIVFFSFTTYSKIIKDDVLNISKLTSTKVTMGTFRLSCLNQTTIRFRPEALA